ncbi:MAG: SUMF1/EgtB/PvdO family nonheme iron enzyme [Pseudomonadota bacterium]
MRFGRLERALIGALAAGLVPLLAGAAPWSEGLTNPAPAEGDLILPMPCEGAMVFRPVDVPGSDVFDDRKIQLGTRNPARAYVENPRTAYVSGSFRVDGRWRYYLGKYEVTVAQAAALAGDCPDPADVEGRLPATGVTVAEAMMAAETYSEWLLAEAPDDLPGSEAYLRLPTETEWEFAARGGVQVGPLEFESPLPPIDGLAEQYLWFDSATSANRELQLTGLLKPNPLGLHDMHGNAAELVSGHFRLNHVGRAHGRAGAFVKRGGDFRTKLAAIHSGLREEFTPLGRRGLRREKTTGYRFALVAPSLPDRDRLEEARGGWEALAESEQVVLEAAQEDPRVEIDTLADYLGALDFDEKADVERRLRGLGDIIDVNIATRNEERARAARAMLRIGVLAALRLRQHRDAMGRCEELMDLNPERYRTRCDRVAEDFEFDGAFYVEHAARTGSEYPERLLAEQSKILQEEFRSRGLDWPAESIEQIEADIARIQAEGAPAKDDVIAGWRDAEN